MNVLLDVVSVILWATGNNHYTLDHNESVYSSWRHEYFKIPIFHEYNSSAMVGWKSRSRDVAVTARDFIGPVVNRRFHKLAPYVRPGDDYWIEALQ